MTIRIKLGAEGIFFQSRGTSEGDWRMAMANRFAKWIPGRKPAKEISLDDVEPLHPDEYPARRLLEILEHRRGEMEQRSHHLGMPDGPGPLT